MIKNQPRKKYLGINKELKNQKIQYILNIMGRLLKKVN